MHTHVLIHALRPRTRIYRCFGFFSTGIVFPLHLFSQVLKKITTKHPNKYTRQLGGDKVCDRYQKVWACVRGWDQEEKSENKNGLPIKSDSHGRRGWVAVKQHPQNQTKKTMDINKFSCYVTVYQKSSVFHVYTDIVTRVFFFFKSVFCHPNCCLRVDKTSKRTENNCIRVDRSSNECVINNMVPWVLEEQQQQASEAGRASRTSGSETAITISQNTKKPPLWWGETRLFQLACNKKPPIIPTEHLHGTLSLCFLLPGPWGPCFEKGKLSQDQSREEDRGVTWDDRLSGMWSPADDVCLLVWTGGRSFRTCTHRSFSVVFPKIKAREFLLLIVLTLN